MREEDARREDARGENERGEGKERMAETATEGGQGRKLMEEAEEE